MRYVAVSQSTPWSAMEIIGVGDSMDEAYSGARAWFENAFDKFGEQRWNELVAMQNNLNAVPETVLHEKTGVTLDEWLARLASTGQSPGAPQPPKPPMSPVVTNVRSGWEPSIWFLAVLLVASRPVYWFISELRTDSYPEAFAGRISPDAKILQNDFASLMPQFLLFLVISAFTTAIWFWIFRWFKKDASLQDYLFFLVILRIAGFIVEISLHGAMLSELPLF
jgi:hypothetical protein